METATVTREELSQAAHGGFVEEKEGEGSVEATEVAKRELLGDAELLTDDQRHSLFLLKEPNKYNVMKLKRVSLSFSGASVFFFTPYRSDGTPLPASVLKFDEKSCVLDEMKKTEKYRRLFGSTTPDIKDSVLLDKEGPCSIMQIDLCGGVFGLPEFAKAPPVQTLASILESELDSPTHSVEVVPIINEALERRMYYFTMSERSIKSLSLGDTYKLVRFVGHGILNRAKEGAKRGAKSPALAAGFQQPVEIDELDPEGSIIKELCGRKQTVRDLFQKFSDMEQTLSESLQRKVVVGLAHNDLHGGNLLVDSQGLVWLIDFATVKEGQHVLMDLTKFLSACTFMYLQDKVNEKNVQVLARILAVTPDATTDLPLAYLNDVQEDPIAVYFFRIASRLRFCMSIYESGPGAPENDGLPFAIALMSWSTRMLSYSEPSLFQKTRALYWSIACMQRILQAIGQDVGPAASQWIEERRELWEGQKGRRLSSSVATDKQAVAAYQFELELPAYLSQAGASEAWSSDILTREKVNVSESCVSLSLEFDGRINTRMHVHSAKAQELYDSIKPVFKTFAPTLLDMAGFSGRVLVVGDAGTGKSVLTKQVFAALAQDQVKAVQRLQDLPKVKDDQGRVVPPKLTSAFLPLRVPLVDLSRIIDASDWKPDADLEVDILNDILNIWVAQKYGQDSNLLMLVQDVRAASTEEVDEGTPNMGLVLLLDGLDEASNRRGMLLDYMDALLLEEPNHLPMITSRPGVLAKRENDQLGNGGYISVILSRLSAQEAGTIAERMLRRMGDDEARIKQISSMVQLPAYSSLSGNPLCLCLLTNVLRKTSMESSRVIQKVELYKRAFKLMLHQSDAAKFMSRDGAADREMIGHIEKAKSSSARRFYQEVAWQAHSWARRTLNIDEFTAICPEKALLQSFTALVMDARLPVFQKVDAQGQDQFQFCHLSFQEVLAAEYVSNVLRFATAKSHARPFVNFMTSSQSQSLSRDRLAQHWWQQVWLATGDMLEEEEFSLWCSILADDPRVKLRAGLVFGAVALSGASLLISTKNVKYRLSKKRQFRELYERSPEIVSGTMRAFEVVWYDRESELVQLRIPLWEDWLERKITPGSGPNIMKRLEFPICAGFVMWEMLAVNVVMTEATRLGVDQLATRLTAYGVHYNVKNSQLSTTLREAVQRDDFSMAEWFADKNVNLLCIKDYEVGKMSGRWTHPRARWVQRPFPSSYHIVEMKSRLLGALRDAYEGTLQPKDEFDANHLDFRSGVTVLMLAAAGGHVQLVRELLQKRALVNARSVDRATPLSFAVENTDDTEGAECVRLLLEARADVTAKSGIFYDEKIGRGHVGGGNPVGFGAVYLKQPRKLQHLFDYGYDVKETNDYGTSAIFHLTMFYEADCDVDLKVRKMLEDKGMSIWDPVDREKAKSIAPLSFRWYGTTAHRFPQLRVDQMDLHVWYQTSQDIITEALRQGKDCLYAIKEGTAKEWNVHPNEFACQVPVALVSAFTDGKLQRGNPEILKMFFDADGIDLTKAIFTNTVPGIPIIDYIALFAYAMQPVNASIYMFLFDEYAKQINLPLSATKKPKSLLSAQNFWSKMDGTTAKYLVMKGALDDWWDARQAKFRKEKAEKEKAEKSRGA